MTMLQSRIASCLVILSALTPLIVAAAPADNEVWMKSAAIPQSLLGVWSVTGVLVDTGTARRALYVPDDPRLTGRQLAIVAEEIRSDLPENRPCTRPRALVQTRSIEQLIQSTLPRLGAGDAEVSVNDYGLPLAPEQQTQVVWINCRDGSFGPKLPKPVAQQLSVLGAHTWMTDLGAHQFALRWYDQTILVLAPIAPDAQPRASFPCSAARSQTEKALCSTAALAAFDTSVAQAYKLVLQRCEAVAACVQRQRAQQAAWIRQRNKCVADALCLAGAMRARLDALMASAAAAE